MKSFAFLGAAMVAAVLCLNSCATIVSGGSQVVEIKATPATAKIFVDGEESGSGTVSAKLKRGKEHVIEVKLDGYRTAKVVTDKGFNAWVIGNLCNGTGILGGAIDFLTGAFWEIDPDHVTVTLQQGTGMLDIPVHNEFGQLDVNAPNGQRLATITVNWQ
jgi:hypothetical protein